MSGGTFVKLSNYARARLPSVKINENVTRVQISYSSSLCVSNLFKTRGNFFFFESQIGYTNRVTRAHKKKKKPLKCRHTQLLVCVCVSLSSDSNSFSLLNLKSVLALTNKRVRECQISCDQREKNV